MKFTLNHKRAVVGNDIDIQVEAEDSQVITNVKTTLDGFDLADDTVNPASVQYQQTFQQAGDAGPLMEHTLIVTVTDASGKDRTATNKWQDAN